MNWPLFSNSLIVAGSTAGLTCGLGFVAALALTAAWPGWRRAWLSATLAVLALPAFLVTNCWIDLLGVNGALRPLLPWNVYSLGGTVLILSLLYWPIPALALMASWQRLTCEQFEADSVLRGNHLLRWLLWPTGRASLLLAGLLVFSLALGNFAVPAILQVKVYPAELWVSFNTHLDPWKAFRLGWPLLVVPSLMLIGIRQRIVDWPRWSVTAIQPRLREQLGGGWYWGTQVGMIAILGLALVLPLVQLLGTRRTWTEFLPAAQAGGSAILNTLGYAVAAAGICLLVGVAAVRKPWFQALWLIFFLPGVLLGIGAVSLGNHPALLWFSRTMLMGLVLLVARHAALARSLVAAAYAGLSQAQVESARLEGATGLDLFRRVIFPQVAPTLAATGYFVYVLCLWEVETILLVIPPGGETLALRIFNLLHYGHNAQVNALCLLLLLLALLPLALLGLVRGLGRGRRAAGSLGLAALGGAFCLSGCSPSKNADQAERIPGASLSGAIFSRVEILGRRGTGAGEFNKPRALTLDTNDNLYVADMTGRVQKFSPDGTFLLSWQMPETDLGKPKGLCCDRDGHIVVLEPHYQRVNHFTPEGKLVAQWGVKGTNAGQLTLPRSVAVDRRNNVIVTEYTVVDRAQKFSPYGRELLGCWGVPGQRPGEFNRAEGVSVDAADRIYVADSCNHRIQVFSPEGRLLRAYGRAGEHSGELSYPYDVQVDREGHQFVCEFGNSRIQVFDAQDRSLEIIGKPGSEPGQFANPWSIALDSKGNLFVADSMNHRVQKLVRRKQA